MFFTIFYWGVRPLLAGCFAFALQVSAAADRDLTNLNLPAEVRQRIEDRRLIDRFLETNYRTEERNQPTPRTSTPKRATQRRGVIRAFGTNATINSSSNSPEKFLTLRGFRAPLNAPPGEVLATGLPADISAAESEAATVVEQRLAHDGLLATLVSILHKLPRSDHSTNKLKSLGFPTDLLAYFAPPTKAGDRLTAWIQHVSSALAAGKPHTELAADLRAVPFAFVPTAPDFQPAIENASAELSAVRLQIGGGYDNGVVPGSSLDFVEQLLTVQPDLKIIASVQDVYFQLVNARAAGYWDLRRRNQLTLISEPQKVTAWAQDNGKAGLRRREIGAPLPAILMPRYASTDEGYSLLLPGDTLLMNGIAATGIHVAQSPLLFQGGNVLVISNEAKRVLLISRGELARNIPLGLREEDILSAFKTEFHADDTLVIPSASYHLDYDVSPRVQNGKKTAFVNDPIAAARIVVDVGLGALEKGAILTKEDAAALRKAAPAAKHGAIMEKLGRHTNVHGEYPPEVTRCFLSEPADAASENFRTFCTALDLLRAETAPAKDAYTAALRRLFSAFKQQREVLASHGWTIVPVPSMPDLKWGMNYLNGVHARGLYLLPAYGGFYEPVDRAAAKAFSDALGVSVKIIPIQCADSQRQYGAVHCMTSVFPAEITDF